LLISNYAGKVKSVFAHIFPGGRQTYIRQHASFLGWRYLSPPNRFCFTLYLGNIHPRLRRNTRRLEIRPNPQAGKLALHHLYCKAKALVQCLVSTKKQPFRATRAEMAVFMKERALWTRYWHALLVPVKQPQIIQSGIL
jgi:hypothetical protein